MAFNRILQYHERNEIIAKLPYSKGTGILRISNEEKAITRNKRYMLPTERINHIFDSYFDSGIKRENTLLYYTLSLIGLTTGARNSEIGRIKRSDINYLKSENVYLLKIYNHKTDYYNTEDLEGYRKIPLHPFVVEAVRIYIRKKNIETDDYIFGIPKLNRDTKK
jgi:integrase